MMRVFRFIGVWASRYAPAVRAPLGEGYRESVLWQEALPATDPEPTAPLPSECDGVVVGGGYCGLAAAKVLAEAGRRVLVLDRERLGWGASTRNGGMVIPELKAGPRTLEAHLGPLGLRLHDEVERAFDHVESLVAGDAPDVECDYERTGQLYVTYGDAGLARMEQLAREHESIGSAAHVVTGDELVAEAGSTRFRAGLVVERTGGLDPARFHAGLARRARDAGAALRGGAEVSRLERTSAGLVVHTSLGKVRSADVLLATNAYADRIERRLERTVLPMGSFIIATEPLAPELAATVLPTRRMAFDDRNLLRYWRHGPGGRLLFGGRKRLGNVGLAEARDTLYESMLDIHPQLAGVQVDRVWGGKVALTLDRLPHCGVRGRVWHATGCNGSGVALNTYMGHRMGAAIIGGALPPFAELPERPIPLRALRRAWLPLVGTWFRAIDRRDARRAA